ncbi:MAG: hypothetical protein ACYC0X_19980 [Pirellulaceae bacterium]
MGTVLFEGQTLASAVPVRTVLQPGEKESFDNGCAAISAVYWSGTTKKLLGFYHAEDHVGVPVKPYNTDLKGHYASVGLAVSSDGRTFAKVGRIITGSVPKQETGDCAQGIGDVSVCPDHTNTYLYAYYTDWTRMDKRPVEICVARSRIADEGRPGTWYKYYRSNFSEPGLGGKDTPVVKGPPGIPSDAWGPHVTYLSKMQKYVIVFTVTAYSDQQDQSATHTGVYFAHSDDGIKWSEPQIVFAMHCIPYNDREIVMHPGFYVQRESDTRASGWLIYGYSRRFGIAPPQEPHYMAWRPITITEETRDKKNAASSRREIHRSEAQGLENAPRTRSNTPSPHDLPTALFGKWEAELPGGKRVAEFRRNGKIAVTSAEGGSNAVGSWSVKGRRVYFNLPAVDGVQSENSDWFEVVATGSDSITI